MNLHPRILAGMQRLRDYRRQSLSRDLLAAAIVTVLLIPQALAYALLAGLPAQVGLYASVVPVIAYAIFGSSRTLAVGPVAVSSLMTASALGAVAAQGSGDYLAAAMVLALLSGLFLLLLGVLRLGFLANFLSHPVIAGFITASGLLIALSQLKYLLGVNAGGRDLPQMLSALAAAIPGVNGYALATGAAVIAFLFWSRKHAAVLLRRLSVPATLAGLLAKAAPVVAVVASIAAAKYFDFEGRQVPLVGAIPAGLPGLQWPHFSWALVQALAVPAVMISVIGYVSSISVSKTLAAKRRQKIDVNRELIGLGAANIGAGLSGAFPVTGGFARSVVNFDAGAQTQMAGVFTAAGIALASIYLTPLLYFLPKATLAATIVVAVLTLVDFSILQKTWRFSRSDFVAVAVTIAVTLLFGVEAGVTCGVGASIALFLYRTSRPHIAEVGLVEGTEHFRNIKRHKVITDPQILTIRVDESLMFSNAGYLEDRIYADLAANRQVKHVILMCSAINEIDWSALEVLEAINERLAEQGMQLHLSEVKGPVMDRLQSTGFLSQLSGRVYLTQYQAFSQVRQELPDPANGAVATCDQTPA
ncbi:sulfate permease [Microbulbifer sp. SAOS-129_SWC]|uniref:SulP family inorganic anion transporter n=1 Tax=Microbulbifer sp. SAOS-129_SWC TaxID=3145235 RepID=UPI003217FE8B